MEGDNFYIEQIRNCDITSDIALRDLEQTFENARLSLTHIRNVFDALSIAPAAAYADAALRELGFADDYRTNPWQSDN